MEITEYTVTKGLKVRTMIEATALQLKPEVLFQLAARINKKRHFLFVSPVLGKHLPVNPSIALLVGRSLALLYSKQIDSCRQVIEEAFNDQEKQANFSFDKAMLPTVVLNHPVTIIGFCETATALGQAFFESFDSPAKYIHTTREEIAEEALLAFEEEHSHATSHRVYAEDPTFFADTSEIILVDDEVTTGNTNLNIIREITRVFPHKKKFTIVSILDWRNNENQQNFRELEQELGIEINEVCLVKGQVEELEPPFELVDDSLIEERNHNQLVNLKLLNKNLPNFSLKKEIMMVSETQSLCPPYLKATGRFGLTSQKIDYELVQDVAKQLQRLRKENSSCLVLGTGEFMYLPMRIASLMGNNVVFHTTTRSPVLSQEEENYPISNKREFLSPEQPKNLNYVYGLPEEQKYQDIFVLYERVANQDNLEKLNAGLGTIKGTNLYFIDLVSRSIYQSVQGSE